MKKAWKGWQPQKAAYVYPQSGPPEYERTPVLVIDASDFPEGYPEIGSEWTYLGKRVEILGPPIKCPFLKDWRVSISRPAVSTVGLRELSPIPKTATDEVVGTYTVSDSQRGSWNFPSGIAPGTYHIIKPGDG